MLFVGNTDENIMSILKDHAHIKDTSMNRMLHCVAINDVLTTFDVYHVRQQSKLARNGSSELISSWQSNPKELVVRSESTK